LEGGATEEGAGDAGEGDAAGGAVGRRPIPTMTVAAASASPNARAAQPTILFFSTSRL